MFPRLLAQSTVTTVLVFGLAGAPAWCEGLEQAWQTAIATDHLLQADQLQAAAAHERLLSAQGQRWPTLRLESSYTLRDNERAFVVQGPTLPGLPNELPYLQREDFAYDARVRLPIYTHFETSHSISAAEASQSATALQADRRRLDLKMHVADAYVAVLTANRLVEVAESNVRSLAAHAHDTVRRHQSQLAPQNDVLAAQVQLAHARQRAIQAHNAADKSRAAYNRFLGRPLTAQVQLDELNVPATSETVEQLTVRALQMRPEVAQLSAQAKALEFQSWSARARTGPHVAVEAGHQFRENRFQDPEAITHAGIALRWNAFDGRRSHHEARALSAESEAALRRVKELESAIALEVRRAWLDQNESSERVKVTREALARSVENLRVAQQRYQTGIGTNTEVLDAETLRVDSHHDYYVALYDAVLAVLRLRYVVGEL